MIYFEDSGVARLIVHQVVPSDSGEYTCKVHGEVIEAETKQQMTKTISSGSIVTIEGEWNELRWGDKQLMRSNFTAISSFYNFSRLFRLVKNCVTVRQSTRIT